MNWYEMDAQQALGQQQVDATVGLNQEQVEQRRTQYGENELRQGKKRTIIKMILEQLSDFMVIVLIVAAVISAALGEVADSVVILLVVVLNAVMGVVQESRAEASLEKLKQMASPHATVLRAGGRSKVEARELVPGDIVLLETGDYVPADLRLIESINLQIQESALTGESQPVSKKASKLPGDTALGDRVNMAFSSSLVTYGRGTGVVVETGMRTEIGRIAKLLDDEDGVKTPLQLRLADLGKKLGIAALAICVLIFAVGLLYGHEALQMFMTAVSLAVAAIPEGLPATVTIVLAVGVKRMITRNTIIRRLPAVETLGSASVVCSDKTGTLTLNRMTVTAATLPFDNVDLEAIKHHPGWVMLGSAAVLCNDAQVGEGATLGDPTETALIDFAGKLAFIKAQMDKTCPRVDEIPFDSQRKRMTTVNRSGNELIVYVKGAVDEMLPLMTTIADGRDVRPITDFDKQRIIQSAERMGADALRVLGFAMKRINATASGDKTRAYESELTFLGMLGMIDPPRPEAREAVAQCRRAGITPVMITGDHAVTASAIARDLGILPEDGRVVTGMELAGMTDEELSGIVRDVRVYARVSPEHKVRIVRAWQQFGHVCAMTGDGVNDAPALKRADIGVAMGITGTEVAKEAAAMIITDDNFATIVAAVEEGRTIYANIIKAVQYLLSCNLGEIITLFVATIFNWTTPLLPIHILWVNLVTDSLPALALGMDPAEPDVMDKPPRKPTEGFLNRNMALRLCIQGALIGLVTLLAFAIGSRVSDIMGQTMAFTVLSLSQLVHAFNQRSNHLSIFKVGLLSNKWLGRAFLASLALQLVVLVTPPLRAVFHLESMHYVQWLMVVMLALVPLLAVELVKSLKLIKD